MTIYCKEKYFVMPIIKIIFPHKTTTSQIIPNGVVVSLFASLVGALKSFNPVCAIKLGYFAEWSLRVIIGEHWHQLTVIGLKLSSGYLL